MNVERSLAKVARVLAPLSLVLFAARHAHADAASEAAADALFKEGKSLATAGNYAAACAKFEASQKKAPAAGTLVNLADCYEHEGKIASAWITYKEAARAAAIRKKTEWETLSKGRIAALEPKLPRLTISPPDNAPADVTIARDGEALARGELSVAIPVDPGSHTVTASAPGRVPFEKRVDVREGATIEVSIPPLDAISSPRVALPSDTGTDGWPVQKTLGLVLGGVGVVGVGVGVATGIVTLGKKSDASALCTDYPRGCSDVAAARALNDDASAMAVVSTVGFVVGGALATAGAVLYFTAPNKTTALRVAPTFAGPGLGASFGGQF